VAAPIMAPVALPMPAPDTPRSVGVLPQAARPNERTKFVAIFYILQTPFVVIVAALNRAPLTIPNVAEARRHQRSELPARRRHRDGLNSRDG